jgi:hypothetical protein
LSINKTDKPLDARLQFAGVSGKLHASANILAATSLEATEMTLNGVANSATDFSNTPAKDLGTIDGYLDYTFAPYSITLIHFKP